MSLFISELVDLDLEDVTKYYDDNWHGIRDEWTLYGRNKYANYLPEASIKSLKCLQIDTPISSRFLPTFSQRSRFWLRNGI